MSETKGEARESFLGRVRSALGRSSTITDPPAAPAVDETLARLASADDNLPAMFEQRAQQVGMNVHRITADELASVLAEVLGELGAQRVALPDSATLEALDVPRILRGASVQIVDWRTDEGLEPQYELDAGITDVHAALAETGTLVCCAGPNHSRGLSLVPPAHVAIVRASDILPDMIDYWARLKGLPHTELPSSQVFITGPSKTADIEGELITGVHGPGEVHILLIEDR